MGKVRPRDTKKLQKSLKVHPLKSEDRHKAWELLKDEGVDAALRFVAETHNPPVLQEATVPYQIWGADQVDAKSVGQMQAAARLPIAVKGALMPDAHLGYGLPIGGVLATDNTVIPYAVGVDIACRMRMTIFDVKKGAFKHDWDFMREALVEETRFGSGSVFEEGNRSEHPVLESPDWQTTPMLKNLHDTAVRQLGTSGGGNHFVEWGTFTVDQPEPSLGIEKAGTYVALLSHSGSRAVGFKIANYYSRMAAEEHPDLPKEVEHLAWLEMDSDLGREYWLAMQLAGEFAAANHEVIHQRVGGALGYDVLGQVENHHNFAWKEEVDGRELIVHRKGATPAGVGVLGIIPGSMGDPGFVVRGKGNEEAINSASHGAGRKMSRRQAKKTFPKSAQLGYLKQRGIELIGGGLDETPHAYKNIHDVIAAQTDLVDVVGEFFPQIVRMAND